MNNSFSEEQQQLLMNIGAALLLCQLMEHPLDLFCELASASVVSVDLLEKLNEGTRRKTVGQMLGSLSQAVEVDPEIEHKLTSFLDHRNALVHRLESEGRSLNTPQGRKKLSAFLEQLLAELQWLRHSLPGLLLAWSRYAGMEDVYNRTYGQFPSEYLDMVDRFEFSTKDHAAS